MTPPDWPPLTGRQRQWRAVCASCVLIGVLELVFGSLYIVSGNPCGAIQVVFGAAATAAGIFCWPTKRQNRLRQIRAEMERERSHDE